MKIAVAGTGYVGLSLATLLSQKNEVVALDVIPEKVEKINNRISPNLEENSINLNFSFLSIVKGYFEINNICILFYTKEPTSIIEVKNVANSFAIDIE